MKIKTKQIFKESIRGFTLLELLIVIGILAILATAAVLILNPAELLREARDSTRVSDLDSLNHVLGLYLSTATSPAMDNRPFGTQCANNPTASSRRVYSYFGDATSSPATYAYVSGASPTAISASSSMAPDGSGWLPIDLNAISGGSPLANFPVDPTNATSSASSTTFVYVYGCNDSSKTYVLTARFESLKYTNELALPSNDGGPDIGLYEVGNAPGLAL